MMDFHGQMVRKVVGDGSAQLRVQEEEVVDLKTVGLDEVQRKRDHPLTPRIIHWLS